MLFQSAPANYSGRIQRSRPIRARSAWFQSAPANYSGRIRLVKSPALGEFVVSIRARQLQRANPFSACFWRSSRYVSIRARQLQRANPGGSRRRGRHRHVSIRARQLQRANPLHLPITTGAVGGVSIRARQLQRANPPADTALPGPPVCFNPRPPITAGESPLAKRGRRSSTCFNPRPPITAGESDHALDDRTVFDVFQSAPANYSGRIP